MSKRTDFQDALEYALGSHKYVGSNSYTAPKDTSRNYSISLGGRRFGRTKLFDEMIKDLEDQIFRSMIYGSSAIITLPLGLSADVPVTAEKQPEDLPLFPRLVETIEPNTSRAREVSAIRARAVSPQLTTWFNQLGGTQYRYTCMCPGVKCTRRVEFFHFKKPEEICYGDAPKCGVCK